MRHQDRSREHVERQPSDEVEVAAHEAGASNSELEQRAEAARRTSPAMDGAQWVQRMMAPAPAGFDVTRLAAPQEASVQRRGGADAVEDPAQVQAAAQRGIAGPGGALPHQDAIQASFGAHDVGGIRAHVGGAAAEGARDMGAVAYATGTDVAFADAPDLHTAAHEAAHVVQQRGGVQLKGGVGAAGDAYEQHADAVADRVVCGESAEGLLDGATSAGATRGDAVQRSSAASEKKEKEPDVRDDYSSELGNFKLKACTPEQALAFWTKVDEDGEAGHDDAFFLCSLLGEHAEGYAKTSTPETIRGALLKAFADGEAWDNLEVVQACVTYLNGVVDVAAPQKADKASLYPGDPLLVASAPGAVEEMALDARAEKAFAALRDLLGGKLATIASFSLADAMGAENQISGIMAEVLALVGDLALAAMSEDETSLMVFSKLYECGFVDRLVYADLQMRSGKVLCHWTDTSIPLLELLNGVGGKFALPKGQQSTPLDETEYGKLRKAAMPAASKAVRAFMR